MRIKSLTAVGLSFLMLCSCAATPQEKVLSLSGITKSLDTQTVTVHGYIHRNLLGATYLYVSKEASDEENFDGGLNVFVPESMIQTNRKKLNSGFCAVVQGVFEARKDEYIYTGNYYRDIGLIRASSIRRSSC